ncbi:MFS transporter [Marinactinospora thermotolerans]|uniref:Arabinose efflux permease n=1 Tax=Marinactinospora thermotolerans DSM 45154 TaxID=1122192 RepID=A0A1T4KEH7_9ACTN|nr:MFS transporter [Marinactinospora thermotolerans]SJZ40868.1 Arabinose efflux permease [Marinactinospora thermotolerans DSM 45154]
MNVTTDIPARMDRLPWARWHWLVLVGLGSVWILDGLEVTIVGAVGSRITEPGSGLGISEAQVGLAASIYIVGACLGALFFGHLTERYGRRRIFLATLGVYLTATVLTALSGNALWFYVCRFFTGFGIGGEYAAINSAIDEMVPARLRGRIALIVNGSYWLGAAAGAAMAFPLLDPDLLPEDIGWRLTFAIGGLLGLIIIVVRRIVPESPRWLVIHGREEEAERVVRRIEAEVERETHRDWLPEPASTLTLEQRTTTTFREVGTTLVRTYPRRTLLGLALFAGQAFLYNAVFFTQALVLTTFFDVPSAVAPLFIVPLALGNFLGPVLLGPLFDTLGRRPMIAATYIGSGLLLIGTGALFQAEVLTATTLTLCWCAVFFVASAGASSAYLTVSEIFPMETRPQAIALFYAIGTALGGILGPGLFGALVASGDIGQVTFGYYLGAGLMILGGLVELFLGVEAARRSLEDIADPLSRKTAAPT